MLGGVCRYLREISLGRYNDRKPLKHPKIFHFNRKYDKISIDVSCLGSGIASHGQQAGRTVWATIHRFAQI